MPSRGNISKSQARPRSSVDFTKLRRSFQGIPKNWISYGVVGHYDENPAFARVENGKVLVEVTLLPSGDEIVAELGMEAQGAGFGFYIPVCIGCRVVVGFSDGTDDPVIIKRTTDQEFEFPRDVGGVSTVGAPVDPRVQSTAAPQWAFLKTPDGTLLAIESGDDGDISVTSGANMQLEVTPGQAIHLKGRTHIGKGWTTPPVGASTGPSGEIVPGVSSTAYAPAPFIPVPVPPTPLVVAPGTPNTGILRIKDDIQSDATVDPAFWAYLTSISIALTALATAWNTAAAAGGGPVLAAAPPLPVVGPVPPLSIGSRAKSASNNTCED